MKLFTPLVLIAICIGAYYVYISPSFGEIGKLTEQRNSYNDVLAKAKDIVQKRDTILTSYTSIPEEDKARLNKFLPEKFDNVLMVNHLNSIANKHGMVIQNVLLTQDDSGTVVENIGVQSIYKTHKVSFYVVGSYENFLAFLKDLELNLNLVDIKKLTISPDSKNPKILNLKYTFELDTYSLK